MDVERWLYRCSNWVFDTCPPSSSRMTLGVLFFSEFEYEKFKDIS